jgi:hypothetical protein
MTAAKASGASPESEATRDLTNVWEDVLKYNLERASGRRKNLREDIIWSISVYDIGIGYIMHVPTQMDLIGANASRKLAAARYGDWSIRMLDPKIVFVEWSDYGPEKFLMATKRKGKDILTHWGDKAGYVEQKIQEGGQNSEQERMNADWMEYELVDHANGRVVWVSEGATPDLEKEGEVILGPEPWMIDIKTGDQVPFLPFICSAGGTSVDPAPEHRLKPILYPILMAELWATSNISGTIMMSQQIASASSVTDVYKGPGAEMIDEDYSGPRRRIDLTPYQEYQQIKDADMDTGLQQVFDRLEGAIQRATVAEVLVTARPLSGEQAFAAYNLQVQQALAALGGIRSTGQAFLQDVYTKMLLISHYTGNNIVGISGEKEYTINSEDIDPDNIRLKVELKADVPADRVQRVTSATQMAQTLQYPMRRILPMLGETDPEGAMEEFYWERMESIYFEARMANLSRMLSGEYDEQVMEAAQQLALQMAAEQEAALEAQGGGGGELPAPGGNGQMVMPPTNPAQGELPFGMVSPEGGTFEARRGRPRGSDQPIAAVPEQGLGI